MMPRAAATSSMSPFPAAIVETTYEQYKDVDGGMVPMRIKAVQDGKMLVDLTLVDLKFADKFDDDTFAKP